MTNELLHKNSTVFILVNIYEGFCHLTGAVTESSKGNFI